jgi:hypothetical protein
VGGDVELVDGPFDGHRVFMPRGPLRPWVMILEPEAGALIAVRVWRLEHLARTGTSAGAVYRLTDSLTGDMRPVYALERRANPRRP